MKKRKIYPLLIGIIATGSMLTACSTSANNKESTAEEISTESIDSETENTEEPTEVVADNDVEKNGSNNDTEKEEKVTLGGKEYELSEIENAGTAELADIYGTLPPLTFEEWLEATSSIPSSKKEMYLNHVHANFGPNVSEGVKELSPEQYVWFIKMDIAMDYGITDKEEVKKDWILTEGEVDESLQDLYYGGNLSDVEKIAYEQIYGITKPEVTYTKKKDTSTDNSSSQSNTASSESNQSSTPSTAEQTPQESTSDTYSNDTSDGESTDGDYGMGEYETGKEFHVKHYESNADLDVTVEGM